MVTGICIENAVDQGFFLSILLITTVLVVNIKAIADAYSITVAILITDCGMLRVKSNDLNDIASKEDKDVVRKHLLEENKKYLLNYNYVFTDSEHITLYLPADINILPDYFCPEKLEQGYTQKDEEEIERIFGLITDQQKLRSQTQSTEEKVKINNCIAVLSREVIKIRSRELRPKLIKNIKYFKNINPAKKRIVLGIVGPSSAGTTSLAAFLSEELNSQKMKTEILSSDSYLHPLRYDENRVYYVEGMGMYDVQAYLRDIRWLKQGLPLQKRRDKNNTSDQKPENIELGGNDLEVLILECPFMGVCDEIREEIDIYLGVVFNDGIIRLNRRLERDTQPVEEGGSRGMTFEQVLLDFTKKMFVETNDAVRHVVLDPSFVYAIWQQDTGMFYKNKEDVSNLLSPDKKLLIFNKKRKELKKYRQIINSDKLAVVVDLDSTLVTAGREINERSARAIIEMRENDMPVVILTSNIGTRQIAEFGHGIGFDTSAKKSTRDEQTKSILQKALQKTFAPEFLNRIDDVIMFNSLGKEEINQIIDLELKGFYDRVRSLGYQLKIAPAARDYIAERGFDANYGARPLKRAIQKYLEDPMAEILIMAGQSDGDTINVGFDSAKSEIKIKIKKKKENEEDKEEEEGS